MRPLRRCVPFLAAAAVALAVGYGCGGDSTGPTGASVTGIAGDNQIAPTGAQLEFPLSFVVLGTSGTPVSGVPVNWTVESGSAVLSPTTSTTNTSGVASTTATLGGVVGAVVIHATVAGLAQPVAFHAEAVDPCSVARAHTIGSTFDGVLATTDCLLFNPPGWYYDFYVFTLDAQQGVTLTMSAGFDTYLELAGTEYVAFNDDIVLGVNTNSRIHAVLAAGNYLMLANSFESRATGPYQVASQTRAQTLAVCEEVWVTRGVTISETIATTDCVASGPFYSDRVRLSADGGSVVEITQRSSVVDPVLTLYEVVFMPDGTDTIELITSNDDSSGTTTDAFISYTVPDPGAFLEIRMGTAVASETGAYTVSFSGTPAPGAPDQVMRWRPNTGARRLPLFAKPLPGGRGTH